jgi:hypothetical protein
MRPSDNSGEMTQHYRSASGNSFNTTRPLSLRYAGQAIESAKGENTSELGNFAKLPSVIKGAASGLSSSGRAQRKAASPGFSIMVSLTTANADSRPATAVLRLAQIMVYGRDEFVIRCFSYL